MRVLSNQIDRASVRTTVAYQLLSRVSVGLEYNPRADDVGLIANWVALTETKKRPALIFGTSSDRIGTPKGRSVYATFSKDLSEFVKLPIAPYAGVAYSGFEHRFLPIGGFNVAFHRNVSALVIFDGVKVHPTLNFNIGKRHVVTFLLAQGKNPGFGYSISF